MCESYYVCQRQHRQIRHRIKYEIRFDVSWGLSAPADGFPRVFFMVFFEKKVGTQKLDSIFEK